MIDFACPRCGAMIEAPETEVAKQGRCGGCGCLFEVPQSSAVEGTANALSSMVQSTPAPELAISYAQPSQISSNLILCPICDKAISRFAAACPGCGHPMRPIELQPPMPVYTNQVITIEQTGKQYKGQFFFAGLLIFVGIIVSCAGVEPWGAIAIFFGLLWMIIAKTGAWWDHG